MSEIDKTATVISTRNVTPYGRQATNKDVSKFLTKRKKMLKVIEEKEEVIEEKEEAKNAEK